MQVIVAAVGRDRRGPARDLFQLYARRCIWPLDVVEIPPARGQSAEQRRDLEAARLLKAVPDGAVRIVLDEGGLDLASADLARRIGAWRDDGRQVLTFLIGGPDGHGAAVLDSADVRLAFGRATWPHQLVRAMLAEQLYRASTILAGHPYHRD